MKYKNIIIFFVITVLLLHGFYVLSQGVVLSDDSMRYAQWADELIANHFNIFAVKSQAHNYAPQYIIFIYLIAIMKVIFSAFWIQAVAIINIIFNTITVALLLWLLSRVTKHLILLFLAGSLYLGSYDVLIWTKFILSDSLYLLVSFLFFVTTLSILKCVNGKMAFSKLKWFFSFCLLLICLVTRPTAIPLIAYLVIATLITYFTIRQQSLQNITIVTFSSLILLSSVVIFSIGLIMAEPSSWPFETGKAAVNYYSERFMDGAVVHDRLETYITVERSSFDFVYLTLLKLISFFAITLDGYSLKHSTYNMLCLGPVYLFSLFAFV